MPVLKRATSVHCPSQKCLQLRLKGGVGAFVFPYPAIIHIPLSRQGGSCGHGPLTLLRRGLLSSTMSSTRSVLGPLSTLIQQSTAPSDLHEGNEVRGSYGYGLVLLWRGPLHEGDEVGGSDGDVGSAWAFDLPLFKKPGS